MKLIEWIKTRIDDYRSKQLYMKLKSEERALYRAWLENEWELNNEHANKMRDELNVKLDRFKHEPYYTTQLLRT